MLAIETRYLGPTETKGARIVATTANGHRATISYPYEFSGVNAHWPAALALLAKHPGLKGDATFPRYAGGGTRAGYVFVRSDAGGDFVATPEGAN